MCRLSVSLRLQSQPDDRQTLSALFPRPAHQRLRLRLRLLERCFAPRLRSRARSRQLSGHLCFECGVRARLRVSTPLRASSFGLGLHFGPHPPLCRLVQRAAVFFRRLPRLRHCCLRAPRISRQIGGNVVCGGEIPARSLTQAGKLDSAPHCHLCLHLHHRLRALHRLRLTAHARTLGEHLRVHPRACGPQPLCAVGCPLLCRLRISLLSRSLPCLLRLPLRLPLALVRLFPQLVGQLLAHGLFFFLERVLDDHPQLGTPLLEHADPLYAQRVADVALQRVALRPAPRLRLIAFLAQSLLRLRLL
mmetsp:Transcript_10573/g.26647  ORF Transcript_10573/g.26647 Transcript_10573/m.26647 type:complete len:305 (+) Transcript_10573:1915-2829(+)